MGKMLIPQHQTVGRMYPPLQQRLCRESVGPPSKSCSLPVTLRGFQLQPVTRQPRMTLAAQRMTRSLYRRHLRGLMKRLQSRHLDQRRCRAGRQQSWPHYSLALSPCQAPPCSSSMQAAMERLKSGRHSKTGVVLKLADQPSSKLSMSRALACSCMSSRLLSSRMHSRLSRLGQAPSPHLSRTGMWAA